MHRFAKLPVLATLALSLCLAACSGDSRGPEPLPATGPPPAAGTIGDGRLRELVEWARASQRMPAMGVVLVRNGQIAEKAAVGLRSSNAAVAVADTDRWHLGSLTKAMTATLAALLVEQGVISWDSTVLEVWPEFSSSIHAGFRGATLRQLLSHTSGMERDIDYGPASITEPAQLIQTRRELSERVLARGAGVPGGSDVLLEYRVRRGRRHARDAHGDGVGNAHERSCVRAARHDTRRIWGARRRGATR